MSAVPLADCWNLELCGRCGGPFTPTREPTPEGVFDGFCTGCFLYLGEQLLISQPYSEMRH